MAERASFESMQRYLRFSTHDVEMLRSLQAALTARIDSLLDDFYARVLEEPEAAAILADPHRVSSLKKSLREWASRLFVGPYDGSYFDLRSRIGRRHVAIALPERFMPLAMGVVREHLTRLALEQDAASDAERVDRVCAVQKILDLELTIMLDTYQRDAVARVIANERSHVIQRIATAISSEMKNLLGVIHTSVLLLRRVISVESEGREHADRIARSARRIGAIADRLVEFARAKRPGRQRVLVSELLEEAVAQVGDAHGCTIECSVEPSDLAVRCAATDLVRALAHLMKNAVESYTNAGRVGHVRVRAVATAIGGSEFLVEDDGPGVSDPHRPRIFEPLFTTREGSMGLGLPFCSDVAMAHGGRIECLPRGNAGAAFRIVLPPATDDTWLGGDI